MERTGSDALGPLLLLSAGAACRRFCWLRGVTYRKKELGVNQELLVKAWLHSGLLLTLDLALRRLVASVYGRLRGRAPPAEFRGRLAIARGSALWLPYLSWFFFSQVLRRGLSRAERELHGSGQNWGIWRLLARTVFKGSRMVLSEEWRELSAERISKLTDDHRDPCLLALHPHGLLPLGAIINCSSWASGGLQPITTSGATVPGPERPGPGLHQAFFPHMVLRPAVASGCFWFPPLDNMFMALGCIEVSEPYIRASLRRGSSVAIFPGGATESKYARPDTFVCAVEKRRGFVRMALEERLDLLPVWTFGEELLAPQMENPGAFISWLQVLLKEVTGLLVPPTLGALPRFGPQTSVCGVPLDFSDLWPAEKGAPISDEALNEAHRRYVDATRRLFDLNKAFAGGDYAKAKFEVA